ncbi:hypothetical protein AVEN_79254-1 [Araneus ventricosus]|uniref:Uncharacterized protein n=1 Tax=Araneus ventricosus TaxID=182803 RepID=A0A4Y1ZT42_ARAVE|nr:hypothetical protein AVEN_79254-1 [Araneus ventricosus]
MRAPCLVACVFKSGSGFLVNLFIVSHREEHLKYEDEKLPFKLVGSRFLFHYKNGMGSSYFLTDDGSYLCLRGRRIMRRSQCPNYDSRQPGHSDYPARLD